MVKTAKSGGGVASARLHQRDDYDRIISVASSISYLIIRIHVAGRSGKRNAVRISCAATNHDIFCIFSLSARASFIDCLVSTSVLFEDSSGYVPVCCVLFVSMKRHLMPTAEKCGMPARHETWR